MTSVCAPFDEFLVSNVSSVFTYSSTLFRVSLEKKVCEDHKVSKDLVVIQEHLVQLVLLVKLEEE